MSLGAKLLKSRQSDGLLKVKEELDVSSALLALLELTADVGRLSRKIGQI